MGLSATEQEEIAAAVAHDGWGVTPPVVPQLAVDRLAAELALVAADLPSRSGARDLFARSPAVRALATSPAVRSVAEAVLGPHCFAVRALLFDRTPSADGKMVWQQGLAIAVRERAHVAGWGPWSEKQGVPHVQPPTEVLERMLAVRVHLDDCGADDGPVRVLAGSHRVGRLSAAAIESWRAAAPAVDCLAERGAIVAFRPLILHASAPAVAPAHRRVVHLDFAAEALPEPLEWHESVA